MNIQADIILVEDNESDAEFTLRALRKSSPVSHILHFQDGEEAVEYIFSTGQYENRNIHETPRLIILDLKMPKLNGLEILTKIKGDERTQHVPVVLLTSSKEENDIANGYKAGVNSYVVKPVAFDELVKVIEAIGSYWLSVNQHP